MGHENAAPSDIQEMNILETARDFASSVMGQVATHQLQARLRWPTGTFVNGPNADRLAAVAGCVLAGSVLDQAVSAQLMPERSDKRAKRVRDTIATVAEQQAVNLAQGDPHANAAAILNAGEPTPAATPAPVEHEGKTPPPEPATNVTAAVNAPGEPADEAPTPAKKPAPQRQGVGFYYYQNGPHWA